MRIDLSYMFFAWEKYTNSVRDKLLVCVSLWCKRRTMIAFFGRLYLLGNLDSYIYDFGATWSRVSCGFCVLGRVPTQRVRSDSIRARLLSPLSGSGRWSESSLLFYRSFKLLTSYSIQWKFLDWGVPSFDPCVNVDATVWIIRLVPGWSSESHTKRIDNILGLSNTFERRFWAASWEDHWSR